MRIAMAQINTTVGAVASNAARIAGYIREARNAGADVVVFPEMAISGYPIYDLIYQQGFIAENLRVLSEVIAPATEGITAIVGFIDMQGEALGEEGLTRRYNSAAILSNGRLVRKVKKTVLPGYDVFDEKRYFDEGAIGEVTAFDIPSRNGNCCIGVQICEDLWSERYGIDVTSRLASAGASVIFSINASPWHIDKQQTRCDQLRRCAASASVPIVYVNLVGGQDEVVFDGNSIAIAPDGSVISSAPAFSESLTVFDLSDGGPVAPLIPEPESIVRAMSINLRDYFDKQACFDGVVIGSSGGIDSAYTLYIATQALGADKVLSVAMPSKFSSGHSKSDAALLAGNLGVRHMEIPISEMFDAGLATFEQAFGPTPFGVAEENDQARCRMQILMKISMKYRRLVCTTGNKSELSVGYWTLYGDGGGGKNVPGDLFKTELYEVVRHINRDGCIIPRNIVEKEPSAELAPNQRDTDSLPPYPVLDAILHLLVEERLSADEIIGRGHDKATVRRVARLYKIAEFKRSQMPQGIKVKRKSFGIGRRIPICNRWNLDA